MTSDPEAAPGPKRSFHTHLVKAALLVALATLLLVSVPYFVFGWHSVEMRVVDRVADQARSAAYSLDTRLHFHSQAVASLASTLEGLGKRDREEIGRRLARWYATFSGFLSVAAFDASGNLLASTGRPATGTSLRPETMERALRGSQPVLSGASRDGAGGPVVAHVGVPVASTASDGVRMVEGSLELSGLADLARPFDARPRTGLVVLDRSGRVAWASPVLGLRVLEPLPTTAGTAETGFTESRSTTAYGWSVAVREPRQFVLLAGLQLLVAGAVSGFLSLALAALLARVSARRVTKPLETLVHHLDTYSGDDVAGAAVLVGPSAPWEVAEVATHLDGLAGRLQEARRKAVEAARDLEVTVEARTAELTTTIVEREAALARVQHRRNTLELIARGSSLPEVLAAIARSVGKETAGAGCSILLVDERGKRLAVGAAYGVPEAPSPLLEGAEIGPAAGPMGRAASSGKRVVERLPGDRPDGSLTCWAEPVLSGSGSVLGVLAVHFPGPRTPTPTQVDSLVGDAQFVGFAIEHARIQDERRQLSRAVEQSPASVVITDADGTIVYVNPRFTTLTGYSAEEALGQNPRMLKSGRTPPETYREMWASLTAGRDWRGEFANRKKNGDLYWELAAISPLTDAQGRISRYVCVKEDISAIKETEKELRRLSQTDALTGLLNRRGFFTLGEQQIRIADRLERPVHLVYVDIDRLKPVNDVFGHTEGDRLIRETGNFLRMMFRSSDVIARIGGDEFGVLLIETAEGSAETLLRRLRENLVPLNQISDLPYLISLSIGMAIRAPRTGISLEALLAQADAAMYEQKKSRTQAPAV